MFDEILEKIKSLEIQGAERIAKAAVEAFAEKIKEGHSKAELEEYARKLIQARATEPALSNAIHYCLKNYENDADVAQKILDYFTESKQKIVEYGAKKIGNGMKIFTHCHSSTVTGIMLEAHKQGKKFTVFCTETRPRFQGRITASELAEAGIETHLMVDSIGRFGLKKADLFLFGSDAITAEGRIVNKIGTHTLLLIANQYDVPSFSCTNSWKFDAETLYGEDEEIENRDIHEVWEKPPQGVIVHNPAFEVSPADKITGVISELGVMKPETLINAIKEAYPWIISNNS